MNEELHELDEDTAARAREYIGAQAVRRNERSRLVEAFAISLVSGEGMDATHPDTIIARAEELADALLRRRAARGGV